MKAILELVGKLSIGGCIGILIGLVFVAWVGPTTNGGTALLILIPVIVCMIIGSILSKTPGGAKKSTEERDSDGLHGSPKKSEGDDELASSSK
jgi:hypothetical protein